MRVYQVVAGMMENIYRMAGEDELATRVRPTIRCSTGKDGPEDEEKEAGDAGMGDVVDGAVNDDGTNDDGTNDDVLVVKDVVKEDV